MSGWAGGAGLGAAAVTVISTAPLAGWLAGPRKQHNLGSLTALLPGLLCACVSAGNNYCAATVCVPGNVFAAVTKAIYSGYNTVRQAGLSQPIAACLPASSFAGCLPACLPPGAPWNITKEGLLDLTPGPSCLAASRSALRPRSFTTIRWRRRRACPTCSTTLARTLATSSASEWAGLVVPGELELAVLS